MFGAEAEADIDVYELAKGLDPNHYIAVICEGCGMIAVSKNEAGEVELAYAEDGDTIELVPISEWELPDFKYKLKV
jgi:hypothetical protein